MPEMNRREFAASLAAPLAARRAQPNVLYVFSDEHRFCSLPGEPYNQADAPNLARLAREGMSFRNCISNYPVCSPYRAMLLTGRWPYQTGIIDNAIQLRSDEPSIARTFGARGYRTGYIGKWHLSPGDEGGTFIPRGPARQGFDDWHVWSNTNTHFDRSFTFNPDTGEKLQPRGYNCTLMTDAALQFMSRHRARPWMLMMSWNPPHPNFADAPTEQMRRYDPASFQFRPNVHAVARNEKLRRNMQGYYAHISAVDAEVGRLLRRLEETGQADNTIVVYSSDHGDMMGSHGFGGKRLPWDESCKVPFLVRYPGVVPAGRTSDALLSTIDVYPSLCGLAGVPVPGHCAGADLSRTIRAEASKTPDSAFLMHIAKENASGGTEHPAPLFRGVRTTQHTYAVAPEGRWCLYDNREDPYQTRNLIDDPGRAKLVRDLDGVLAGWLRKAQDPFPRPPYGRGRDLPA